MDGTSRCSQKFKFIMSYLSDFERSFSAHTLNILKSYEGPYDATLIVNCLLGLLVLPKETMLAAIPNTPFSDLPKWGISEICIKNSGRVTNNIQEPATIRGLVANLRHSVAHFRIKPVSTNGNVHSFEYKNDNGLNAVIPNIEMRQFLCILSEHLSK